MKDPYPCWIRRSSAPGVPCGTHPSASSPAAAPPPQAVPQNKKGHLIGHIKDIGHDPSKPDTRLYATSIAQPWHNDGPADLVSLLCLKPAKSGGSSSWASSITVYNEMLRRAPELAAVMSEAQAWWWDRKGEIPPGKQGFYEMPVFNFFQVSS